VSNFGAGFTGGFAYVLDLERDFVDRYNHELIDISRIHAESMQSHLQHLENLLDQHLRRDRQRLGGGDRERPAYLQSASLVVKPKAASIDSPDRKPAARGLASAPGRLNTTWR